MTEFDFKKLQNGSDIRGIALTGIPGELPNLTDTEAERLAKGYLLWLCNKTGKAPQTITISVGRDPRVSGQHLKGGLFMGLGPYGVRILDCGLASTPAMFMSTVFPQYNCDGAIMITASHLPYNRNGFKFFDKDGGLNKSDITQIIEFAQSDEKLSALGEPDLDRRILIFGKKGYPSEEADLMETYCAHLRTMIQEGVNHPDHYDRPLTGLKIVVDAGNGSGGFYAKKVLAPLGADTSASQYLSPDGTFPNHPPNPEDRDAMESVALKTISNGADLGLIFDTDVDRSAAVDHRGREIARNGIVALAAALIAEDHPGSTVVTDSITSDPLTVFLEESLGLKHLRFKRGYKNVINKAIELNEQGIDCQLAIETSGHAALKENYFLDDGAYLATKIVIKTAKLHLEGKTLDSLIETLRQPAEATEVRIPITALDFGAYGDRILKDLQDFAQKDPEMTVVTPNYEGVRIAFADGWCLLRKSLHDPILPLNVESEKNGGCAEILDKIKSFLSPYEGLDLSPMKK
ncbi:phosphomannomutase/phosphoglucomutase [Anaerovorax odorimutans]|uniref:Phosphomannomutase/phosphoglucomutase n=1 Tax=Anaerovorax odorimutans TaxID=109327 RepID=A0ABT1RNC5_9FIRM|nr:phosphomannomutase/phosphoglucomutase [Anaerovorax odorimutans]MCQ4636694.1 phosphomannomutase/phosphoglucomutase [Anaerovorax odorimutans]